MTKQDRERLKYHRLWELTRKQIAREQGKPDPEAIAPKPLPVARHKIRPRHKARLIDVFAEPSIPHIQLKTNQTTRHWLMMQTPAHLRLTDGQWEMIKARYWYRCAYCHKPKPLTKDHVIPISKGGMHTHWNIIPACQSCNSRKCDRDALQYNPLIFRRV